MFLKVLILFNLLSISTQSDLRDKGNRTDISMGFQFAKSDIMCSGIIYSKNDYYTDNETLLKMESDCKKNVTLKKCCPHHYGFNLLTQNCTLISDGFNPPIYDEKGSVEETNALELFNFLMGHTICGGGSDEKLILGSNVSNNSQLRKDGKLYMEFSKRRPSLIVHGPDKYCIDTFVTKDAEGKKKMSVDTLICVAEEKTKYQYVLYSICMLISCVFILATVAVYSCVPDLQNLHGWVLIAHLLSFFVGFSFLATLLILLFVKKATPVICLEFTFVIYFSFLSAFFWMSAMGFDIWWTFCGKKGFAVVKVRNKARFQIYSLYAFGFPTILTILMACMEFYAPLSHPLHPTIRHFGCFLRGKSRQIYLYIPMVVLCISNLIFFTLTAVKIAIINRETAVLKSEGNATHDKYRNDKQRFLLYVKLFAVMGINWINEVISSLYPELEAVWNYTDVYNLLLGVLFFIIFICKRKIFNDIKKRYEQIRSDLRVSLTKMFTSRTCTSRDDFRMTPKEVDSIDL